MKNSNLRDLCKLQPIKIKEYFVRIMRNAIQEKLF